jgi:hypothetical protein
MQMCSRSVPGKTFLALRMLPIRLQNYFIDLPGSIFFLHILTIVKLHICGPCSLVGIATGYGLDGPRDRIPVGASSYGGHMASSYGGHMVSGYGVHLVCLRTNCDSVTECNWRCNVT